MSTETNLKLDVLTPEGKKDGKVELPAEIFDAPANIALLHQVVVAQQAAARQGTHSTKTRAEVRGGGAKPYRQKGTGRARQGSTRAPHFTGGGVVHGPQPRDYSQRTPKKMKAAALRGALRTGRATTASTSSRSWSPGRPCRPSRPASSSRSCRTVATSWSCSRARMTPHGAAWPTSGTSTRSRPIS